MFNLNKDINKAKQVAKILHSKFNSKEGIFGHNNMPEDVKPDTIKWGSEVPGASKYEYLMFITMVVSIDYMRNANRLWESGRITFNDEPTKWLFFPKEVVKHNIEDVKKAMQKHKLSQRPTKDSNIWFKVAESLNKIYEDDPLNIVKEASSDASIIYSKKFDYTFKKNFPSFTGNKIYPLWIRMLKDNLNINLKNLDKVPLPVDVHVARSSFRTGALIGEYNGSRNNRISSLINEVWREAIHQLNDEDLTYTLQLDEPLWHLSKYGCRKRKDLICPREGDCPVGKFCVTGDIKINSGHISVST